MINIENWSEEFDKRFSSFGIKYHKICKKCDGKPFDGSSVADGCGSADEYIKDFIKSLLSTQEEKIRKEYKEKPKKIFKCPECVLDFVSIGYDNPVFYADKVADCPKCGGKCWELKQ